MIQTLWITPEQPMTVCVPEFRHHGEDDDGLEVMWRLPAYTPDPDSLRPEFVPPWRPGGTKIRPYVKALWCEALRSGKWRQIFGDYHEGRNGACAMGVLYNLARDAGVTSAIAFTGVSDDTFGEIANIVINLNDMRHALFSEIADYIERTY